jgi:starvation-inducible DNA-binding protein
MDYIQNDGHKPKLEVIIQPNIGLDSDVRRSIVDILQKTLANEVVLTVKTQNALWNLSGAGYLERQILFDSHVEQLNDMSDEVAERTRMMGSMVIGSLREFIDYSLLNEQPGDPLAIMDLLADHETIIRYLREDSKKCSDEFEDEGTFDLLVGIMRLHEKMAWMLRSVIENDPVHN